MRDAAISFGSGRDARHEDSGEPCPAHLIPLPLRISFRSESRNSLPLRMGFRSESGE